MKHNDGPPVLPCGPPEFRRRVVERPIDRLRVIIDRRRPKEIGIGLPGVQTEQVGNQLLCKVFTTSRITADKSDVRITLLVEMIVMQTMQHTIRAHGEADWCRKATADEIIQAAGFEQSVMRRIVGQDEACLLATGDDDHGRYHRPGRPPIEGHRNRQSDQANGLQHTKPGPERIDPRQSFHHVVR